ncbi:MAG: nuclear transport factor 2 family protein [Pseudomonadaceae bacterium]|nr:nuclear transport factor 2 family protein [Pseudomonadaceae bacterium]
MERVVGAVPEAAEIADRLAISDVLAVHCQGVDRADEAALKACYWPDATVAYGGFNGAAHEFCASLPTGIRAYRYTQHKIGNTSYVFTGDRAFVETYVTAYHYRAAADGDDQEMTYIGRYLDRFEKRADVWKMSHRQVVMDWNQNAAATAILAGPPFDGLARGDRHEADPLTQMMQEAGGVELV